MNPGDMTMTSIRFHSPKPIPRDPPPWPQPRSPYPDGEPIPGPIGPKGGDASRELRATYATST